MTIVTFSTVQLPVVALALLLCLFLDPVLSNRFFKNVLSAYNPENRTDDDVHEWRARLTETPALEAYHALEPLKSIHDSF